MRIALDPGHDRGGSGPSSWVPGAVAQWAASVRVDVVRGRHPGEHRVLVDRLWRWGVQQAVVAARFTIEVPALFCLDLNAWDEETPLVTGRRAESVPVRLGVEVRGRGEGPNETDAAEVNDRVEAGTVPWGLLVRR